MSSTANKLASVGRLPPADVPNNAPTSPPNAASGDAAYDKPRAADVVPAPDEPPPRRRRRLHRVWPDRDGNISYLLTLCVDGRGRVLSNETTFERFVAFLLDSPTRYHWFGRRFVVMPDHVHLIAHQGHDAVRLGQWIKALKAVVGGLERRAEGPVRAPGLQAAADVASHEFILHEVIAAVSGWRKTGQQLRLKASILNAYASAFEHPLMKEARGVKR